MFYNNLIIKSWGVKFFNKSVKLFSKNNLSKISFLAIFYKRNLIIYNPAKHKWEGLERVTGFSSTWSYSSKE